jgi:hypothetical protein
MAPPKPYTFWPITLLQKFIHAVGDHHWPRKIYGWSAQCGFFPLVYPWRPKAREQDMTGVFHNLAGRKGWGARFVPLWKLQKACRNAAQVRVEFLSTLAAVLLYSLCTQPWLATQITHGEPGQHPPDVSLVYFLSAMVSRLVLPLYFYHEKFYVLS